ncbi:MAG TPA: undecaprenyldiphospho-muramoylpentapeptide beta-N-acetylglucosaminyltransferase [Deltaproteobacteria bacterium]|nr:MAG: undecaprenyldiphospho-muramoylpentapeptide beta-N-acetylglucosaminyltransferase [Deltaproteobacteria bacterium GWA2_55_82]OGQ62660.1 MAG: undecaprenyldiphospho-muramoylpentapeptide beta-N-acetylglucosaminyltransferase [Deltaproteobacteria bacterium RIFCSPLOWO2_02_FULL_55_12]OIJ74252.1 MAG: undecaprenyldiphospho-muramoylpentapeptide beta-N-acetylglucosaminyltransferase [Deltaproteobacteria bacterium GWC2_55_46]HBG46881.1 undecaprenyldiphospho-muramoylpentapeptide beta-N-acetylglucosaminyl
MGDAEKKLKLVFAGGGTGGHLFPAIALAEEFRRKDPGVEVAFVGGKGGLEEKVVPKYGYPIRVFNVEGIKRRRGLERIRAIAKAVKSTIEALQYLRSMRPDGVIGSGSYSSAPVVTAARLLGIKTAILEQNALPGLTNRLLGRFVDRVYISFEESRRFFPGGRTILSGNPVRREIIRKIEDGRVAEKFTILVFGGSQGATAINAAFLDAIEFLTEIWSGLRVMHQTGSEGYEMVCAAYRRKNLKVEVFKFIEDMGAAYSSADLVVCRAGATSLAEITAAGLPAILIPYPFASDDHQTVNARCLEKAGAAVMIKQDKLTGAALAESVRRLYENRQALRLMRDKSKAMGRPRAAQEIAENFSGTLHKR